MSNPAIPVTQGGALSVGGQLTLDDGTPVDISTATITAVVQDALLSVTQTPTIALTAGLGAFVLTLDADQTAALPAGLVFGQIKFELPAAIVYSDSFPIRVSPSVGGL